MKKLLVLTIIFSSLLFLTRNVYAVGANPESGSYASGATFNITVTASPQTGENAVTLRLTASNMTITNFVPASGGQWVGAIAECGGGTYFTATEVCVSLAKSADITAGETLGTITATMGSSTSTLTASSGTQYSDGVDTRNSTGTIGTYSVSTSGSGGSGGTGGSGGSTGGGTLPNTSFFEDKSQYIILGSIFIFVGITFYAIWLADFNLWKKKRVLENENDFNSQKE